MMQAPPGSADGSSANAQRRGRPRDPALEYRIFDAALDLYGRHGWSGFNFDGLAKAASVGKDAIYRRWSSRDALLAQALAERWRWIDLVDTGILRDDLVLLARTIFDLFTGAYGEVALNLRADARKFPEVAAVAGPYRESLVRQGRAMVRRAIDRADLPPGANPGLIMDLLVGAVVNRIVHTPPHLRPAMLDRADVFVEQAVDVVLVGVRHVFASSPI